MCSSPEKAVVHVELDRVPQRVYLQRIDEDHCNPLRVWQEMGSPNDLNRDEVSYIKNASQMLDEELEYCYENGVLRVEAALGINDLYFIRIEK